MSVRTPGTDVICLERESAPIAVHHRCRPISVTSRLFRAPMPLSSRSRFALITNCAMTAARPVLRGVPGRFALTGSAGTAKSAIASAAGLFAAAGSGSAKRLLSASASSGFAVQSRAAMQRVYYEAFIPADQEEAMVDADGNVFMCFITLEGTE